MSLTTRAIVAVVLMVGFYALSLAIAAALLWIPYAEWIYLDRVHPKIAIACVVGALIILWSIVPRPDRFQAPGPRITATDQPRLFHEIADIANATAQPMPDEVYLVPEVNAWVAQRGGLVGIGSRRVMALGVPLMGLLTVSQFRAVLAHEFGHYHGGDTRLGPWVYKTRMAIWRTLHQLDRAQSSLIILFNWYGKMFLRVTLAISRAQEYAADRLAAQLEGATALIEGLKQLHKGGVAWDSYLQSEVVPVVSAGYRPPLSAGFNHFLAVPTIRGSVEENLAKELSEGKADKHDSHPALPERIAAIRDLARHRIEDDRPATALLDALETADMALLALESSESLKPLPWDKVLTEVYVPEWEIAVNWQAEALHGLNTANLANELWSGNLRSRLKNPEGIWPTAEERGDMARNLAGCALAVALYQRGWTFHALPGEMYCEKDGYRIEPFIVTRKLSFREMSDNDWQHLCVAAAIANLPLEPARPAAHA